MARLGGGDRGGPDPRARAPGAWEGRLRRLPRPRPVRRAVPTLRHHPPPRRLRGAHDHVLPRLPDGRHASSRIGACRGCCGEPGSTRGPTPKLGSWRRLRETRLAARARSRPATSSSSPSSPATATRSTTTPRPRRRAGSAASSSRAASPRGCLNAVVAEDLPGTGSVFLHVDWSFKAPVRPGDEITAEVEVLESACRQADHTAPDDRDEPGRNRRARR